MPRPGRPRATADVVNAGCVACHLDEAREWAGSQHQTAFTDQPFQRAFAIEPAPFCRGCHAPEASVDGNATASVESLGVACVTCHVPTGGLVLAAPREGGAPSDAPHPVFRDARFAAPEACVGCHEFTFPGEEDLDVPAWMQTTGTEHAESDFREKSCAACHMPFVDGGARRHRSHAFASVRDPAALRAALDVHVVRVGAGTVRFELAPRGVGHAFPTGDLFRRIVVSAEAVGDDGAVIASKARELGRHFTDVHEREGESRRVEIADDRPGGVPLGDEGGPVILDLGESAAGFPIHYRVRYERVLFDRSRSEDDTIDDVVVLSEGALP
jgi:hypothetical protein